MHYTMETLKKHLGKDFNPDATYSLATHSRAASRVVQGTHRIAGKVPDFTSNEDGTMIVLEKLSNDIPKSLGSKLRSRFNDK